jgi:nitrite reductase (NADH) small subunit/3-phenylpropionate/trans-cinnamate dioxygenase ferredoxin subunit
MAKVLVAKLSELSPGTMKQCQVEGHDDIVIANVGGKLHAMRGLCNHAGGPLGEGTIEDVTITCPWHGAKWDITSGKNTEFAMDLDPEPVYTVSIEGNDVYVEI